MAILVVLGIAVGFHIVNRSRVGTTLVYEPVLGQDKKADGALRFRLLLVIERRVNPGLSKNARIRELDNGQIEIGIFGDDPRQARRIQSLLDRFGSLEFRILANSYEHKDLIDLVRSRPEGKVIKDSKGTSLARWVAVRPQEVDALKKDNVIATREAVGGGLEVLVVIDPFNVNGTHLKYAAAGISRTTGMPEVDFVFDSEGGRLFGEFTGDNVPIGDVRRRLGVIVDDRLYTAPTLQAQITDRGVITGNFTPEEVKDMVDVLNSGALPCRIKLVPKQETAEKQ